MRVWFSQIKLEAEKSIHKSVMHHSIIIQAKIIILLHWNSTNMLKYTKQ